MNGERAYFDEPAWIQYAASVHGDPTKPSTVEALPTSERKLPKICWTNGRLLAGSSIGFNLLTSSMLQETLLCHQPTSAASEGRPGMMTTLWAKSRHLL